MSAAVKFLLSPRRESDEVELGPGDYVTFPGDVAHDYEALEPSWLVLIMEHI